MAERSRPPGTQVLISEDYLTDLEDNLKEAKKKVQVWKNCLDHTTDFLEILREHFDNFDKILKEVNEASNTIEFVVDADENIKYRINESQKS